MSTLAQITLSALQQATIAKCATFILQLDTLKKQFRGRSIPTPAAAEPGSYAVEAAGSARSCRSATAAAHTCYLSTSAGEHLIPRMRPGPQDQGGTVPTSLPGALVVVLKKEITIEITVMSGTLWWLKTKRSASAILNHGLTQLILPAHVCSLVGCVCCDFTGTSINWSFRNRCEKRNRALLL